MSGLQSSGGKNTAHMSNCDPSKQQNTINWFLSEQHHLAADSSSLKLGYKWKVNKKPLWRNRFKVFKQRLFNENCWNAKLSHGKTEPLNSHKSQTQITRELTVDHKNTHESELTAQQQLPRQTQQWKELTTYSSSPHLTKDTKDIEDVYVWSDSVWDITKHMGRTTGSPQNDELPQKHPSMSVILSHLTFITFYFVVVLGKRKWSSTSKDFGGQIQHIMSKSC